MLHWPIKESLKGKGTTATALRVKARVKLTSILSTIIIIDNIIIDINQAKCY